MKNGAIIQTDKAIPVKILFLLIEYDAQEQIIKINAILCDF